MRCYVPQCAKGCRPFNFVVSSLINLVVASMVALVVVSNLLPLPTLDFLLLVRYLPSIFVLT